MAKSFLVPIQMNQLEILQPVIHNNGSDPSGVEGQLYMNTATNVLKYYDGTEWKTILASGSEHAAVTLSTDLNNNLLSLSTQELGLDAQTGNTVFASPSGGGSGAPSFRSLVDADMPASYDEANWDSAWTHAQIVDGNPHGTDYADLGEMAITNLGSYTDGSVIIGGAADWTALTAGTQGDVLTMGTNRPEWAPAGTPGAHDLLGTAHNNTTTKATPTRGDLITGQGVSTTWTALVLGGSGDFLMSDGTDAIWGDFLNNLTNESAIVAADAIAFYDATATATRYITYTQLVTALESDLTLASALADLTDVSSATQTSGFVLASSGGNYAGRALLTTDIPDLSGTYLTSSDISDMVENADLPNDGIIMATSSGVYAAVTGSASVDTIETTLTDDDTHIPTSGAVTDAINTAVAGGVTWVSGYAVSTNTPALEGTPTINKGSMYTCTDGGDFYGQTLEAGDVLITNQDNPTALAHWTIVSGETADAFLQLQDVDESTFTGHGGFFVMVNSTPDGLEFVDPSAVNLGDLNNDLADLTDGNGITDFTYDGSGAASVSIQLITDPGLTVAAAGLALGTPTDISEASTSTVSGSGHSHALDPNIDLSYFDNDLAALTQTANGGLETFSYNGSAAETLTLDLNNLATVTTMTVDDLIPIYDDSVSGTRNVSFTTLLSYIGSLGTYTKKVTEDCAAALTTVVDTTAIGNKNVTVQVYRATTPWDEVEVDVERTTDDSVTVRFATAPTLAQFKIVVIG